jgi:hypothetical protein
VTDSDKESGRVVIDQRTFKEENFSDAVALTEANINEDSERMLCPPYVYGYSLARKRWCRFYVDCISDCAWKKSAMNDLVLPEARKSVLEALVFSHAFPPRVRDEAEQKGKGLVVLLHGSPGSGKTLTAGKISWLRARDKLTSN